MFFGRITLWFRSECDARRVGFGSIRKAGGICLQCVTTKPRQSSLAPLCIVWTTCFCRAVVSVGPCSRSRVSWAYEVLWGWRMLSPEMVFGFLSTASLSAAACNCLVRFRIPSPLNLCLNHRSLTMTTTMFMKPRLVMMGVIYTKTCW